MKYRLEFLDVRDNVVRDLRADAVSDFDALRLVDKIWPRDAFRTQVHDQYGKLVVSLSQAEWWDAPARSSEDTTVHADRPPH
jgi:hypothetical protein